MVRRETDLIPRFRRLETRSLSHFRSRLVASLFAPLPEQGNALYAPLPGRAIIEQIYAISSL